MNADRNAPFYHLTKETGTALGNQAWALALEPWVEGGCGAGLEALIRRKQLSRPLQVISETDPLPNGA